MSQGVVHHLTHPLIQHKLTLMRQKDRSTTGFRTLLHEVALLMAYELTRDMPTHAVEIETPLERCTGTEIDGKKTVFVVIMRAGAGLLDGMLEVAPGATIAGNLTYSGPNEATIPAGAVEGTVTFTERVDDETKAEVSKGLSALAPLAFFAGLTWKVIAYLMAFVTGLALILLAQRRMAGASSVIRTDTGPVAGWGALALLVTPLAAGVVCVTVIGLPLGIIALVLWGILLYLCQLPVGLLLGHLILGQNKPLESKGFMIGSLALGLLILSLLRAIPVIGFFIWFATALFGFGAFVVNERRLMRAHRAGDNAPIA
ncbi:MAG: hypothetical protein E4G93_05075 [Dehalococcoidia bacterium]|nr:MAG: hypothetical protein E4G93_05075 [Dehalococcoidia bacterium]